MLKFIIIVDLRRNDNNFKNVILPIYVYFLIQLDITQYYYYFYNIMGFK